MQFSHEEAHHLEVPVAWKDLQAPLRVTPSSNNNSETFGSSGCTRDLSLAEISQHNSAIPANLHQASREPCHLANGESQLPEPRHVGGVLAHAAEAWRQPMHLQQSAGPACNLFDLFTSRREEELNQYIRQQAVEYSDGQAEWSRQIAEVRSECRRELEKVRLEKEESERQARQELLRLQQRLRDSGVKDEGLGGPVDTLCGSGGSTDVAVLRPSIGAWASCVSIDEHQELQCRCVAAEDRIRELEQYIKEQSAKQLLGNDDLLKEKDSEIQQLQQAVLLGHAELRQQATEIQTTRAQYQRKAMIWEKTARRLLAVAEQVIGKDSQQASGGNDRGGSEGEEIENGKFGRTAKKLALTLPEGDHSDVGYLQQLLKDVLKNGKEGRDTKRSQQKAKEECKSAEQQQQWQQQRQQLQHQRLLPDAVLVEQRHLDEDGKPGEGCSTPSFLSDSSPSSRETSPGPNGLSVGGRSASMQASKAVQAMAHFAQELRQLITLTKQQDLSGPLNQPCLSPIEFSPRSVDSIRSQPPPAPIGTPPQFDEYQQTRKPVDSLAPARKEVTQTIIAVEKMLRSLDRDLKRQCERLFGHSEILVPHTESACHEDDNTVYATAMESEAKRQLPVSEDLQLLFMTSLRHAQIRFSAALAEFVLLPQKIKVIFDLTKQLSTEVTATRSAYMDMLQRHPQASTGVDDETVVMEIREELDRGISHEEQLLAARIHLKQAQRDLASRDEQLRKMEQKFMDVRMTGPSQTTKPWWTWGNPPGGMVDLANQQAWGFLGQGMAPAPAEWPTAPIVA
jgi:hypothetical protein